jgi:DNA invertase Pin-like site-specific DNA recombinase
MTNEGPKIPAMPRKYDEALIGYVRVSTEEQTGNLQRQAMDEAGIHPDLICEDVESGWSPKKERQGLRSALKCCHKGATLVVWKFDRLGRNTIEILLTLHRLNERGVKFRSLTQPQLNTENTDSATGRFVLALHAALT